MEAANYNAWSPNKGANSARCLEIVTGGKLFASERLAIQRRYSVLGSTKVNWLEIVHCWLLPVEVALFGQQRSSVVGIKSVYGQNRLYVLWIVVDKTSFLLKVVGRVSGG